PLGGRVPTSELRWGRAICLTVALNARSSPMGAVCQETGATPGFGHNISHSHRPTKRRFDPNVQKKTYYVPSLRRNVTLNVSAKGIKVIDARGIESVVKDLLARGEKI